MVGALNKGCYIYMKFDVCKFHVYQCKRHHSYLLMSFIHQCLMYGICTFKRCEKLCFQLMYQYGVFGIEIYHRIRLENDVKINFSQFTYTYTDTLCNIIYVIR